MTARRMKYALPIVAVFAWAGPAPTAPFSDPPRLEKPQAGFYRLKIGEVDVIAVNDGASSFDVLGVLAKDKPETAAKIMAKSYAKSPVEASAIHAPDAQFEDPSITIEFDVDQKAAGAQRQKALADAAKNGYLIALDHMYFPGIGRLRKEKVGYRWIPAPYINDSQKP
jgi:hypothetical protein